MGDSQQQQLLINTLSFLIAKVSHLDERISSIEKSLEGKIVIGENTIEAMSKTLEEIRNEMKITRKITLQGTPNVADVRRREEELESLIKTTLSYNKDRKSVQIFIGKDGTKLFGTDSEVALKVLQFIYNSKETMELNSLLEKCGIKHDNRVTPDSAVKLSPLLRTLMFNTEAKVQELLRVMWVKERMDSFAADCHSSTQGLPLFKYPMRETGPFTMTAKPDILSLVGPLSLELKPLNKLTNKELITERDFHVIQQSFERVNITFTLNETLKRCASIACCGARAWLILAERELHQGAKILMTDKYSIIPIKVEHIDDFWYSFNLQARKDPSFYCFQQLTFPLADILAKYGYHISYCFVRIINYATSLVAKITPGHVNQEGDFVLPRASEKTFVVKFNMVQERESKELKILQYLWKNNCPAISYVLSLLDGENSQVLDDEFMKFNYIDSKKSVFAENKTMRRFLSIEEKGNKSFIGLPKTENYNSKAIEPEKFWFNFYSPEVTNVKAIVQREGFPIDQGYYQNIVKSLQTINSLNVFHSDIRESNVMNFNIPIQDAKTGSATVVAQTLLIDFDLAELGENPEDKFVIFPLPPKGARRDAIERCKPSLVEEADGLKVKWDASLEFSMLFRVFKNLKELESDLPIHSEKLLSHSMVFPKFEENYPTEIFSPVAKDFEMEYNDYVLAQALAESLETLNISSSTRSESEVNEALRTKSINLVLYRVLGDGNCYFSACAASLNSQSFQGRTDWNARELRAEAVDYLRRQKLPLFRFATEQSETMDEYLALMSTDKVFARDEIISAVPLMLNVDLYLYFYEESSLQEYQVTILNAATKIHLLYYGKREHYDALVSPEQRALLDKML